MTAVIELINKILDFIKSFISKKAEKEVVEKCSCNEQKEPKAPEIVRLRDYFNANERKNLANWAKDESLTLMKNVEGELVITANQAFLLWKGVQRGETRGKKRIEMINYLVKRVFRIKYCS